MPQPIALTDEEMDIISALSAPVAVQERPRFLQAVAEALAGRPTIGVGVIHQIGREIQRAYTKDAQREASITQGRRRAPVEA